MKKKILKKELAARVGTAPEYMSACRTGAVKPSLDFIIRVLRAVPDLQLKVEDISPRIAAKLREISELEGAG